MKQIVLALGILFLIICPVLGQTFYYVNSIYTIPADPTSTDSVQVCVSGDLSATNSLVSFFEGIVDSSNMVTLNINAASPGVGGTVLVPFDTCTNLGILDAGTYNIGINGGFVGDFVTDSMDYVFEVSLAQDIEELGADSYAIKYIGQMIKFEGKIDLDSEYTIYNVAGQNIKQGSLKVGESEYYIELEGLPAGLYSFHLQNTNGAFGESFMVY